MASGRWDFLKSQVKRVNDLGQDGFYQQERPISYGMHPSGIACQASTFSVDKDSRDFQAEKDSASSLQESETDIKVQNLHSLPTEPDLDTIMPNESNTSTYVLTKLIADRVEGLTHSNQGQIDYQEKDAALELGERVESTHALTLDDLKRTPASPPTQRECPERIITSRLLEEYDGHIDCLQEQVSMHKKEQETYKTKLNRLVDENKRLCRELKESVQSQISDFDYQLDSAVPGDQQVLSNFQQQLQMALKEKDSAMQMWQTAVYEVENLKSRLDNEKFNPKSKDHDRQIGQIKMQYTRTVTDLNREITILQKELSDSRTAQQVAAAQMTEMRQTVEQLRDRLVQQQYEKRSVEGAQEKVTTRAGQLHRTVVETNSKLETAKREICQVRKDNDVLEAKIKEVVVKSATSDEREYDAAVQVRDSVDMMEAAMLEKDQALGQMKQADDEIDRLQTTICRLLEQTGLRTREEVDKIKKICKKNMSHLVEEIQNLEMCSSEKQAQIERMVREKRAVESELEKLYQQGTVDGCRDNSTREELSRRACESERARDESQLRVETMKAEFKINQQKLEQDRDQLQMEAECLQERLTTLTAQFAQTAEERVSLAQRNDMLQRELQAAGVERVVVDRRNTKQTALREVASRQAERDVDAKLQSQEDSHRSMTAELRRMLSAQQRMCAKWKDECRGLTSRFETKVCQLREENCEQKRRNCDVVKLLRQSKDQTLQAEQMLMEYNQHIKRMESHVRTAEMRASCSGVKMDISGRSDEDILEERQSLKRQLENTLRESMSVRCQVDPDLSRPGRAGPLAFPPSPTLYVQQPSRQSSSHFVPQPTFLHHSDVLTSLARADCTSSLHVNVGSMPTSVGGSAMGVGSIGQVGYSTSSFAGPAQLRTTLPSMLHLSPPPLRIKSTPDEAGWTDRITPEWDPRGSNSSSLYMNVGSTNRLSTVASNAN